MWEVLIKIKKRVKINELRFVNRFMKLKQIYIIPLIGLGWYVEKEETKYMGNYTYLNIVVLCVKIQFIKRTDI